MGCRRPVRLREPNNRDWPALWLRSSWEPLQQLAHHQLCLTPLDGAQLCTSMSDLGCGICRMSQFLQSMSFM